ncbi:WcaA Glycosyltransferases involved in cell wall biogenesis [Methylophilaceae bacterium]
MTTLAVILPAFNEEITIAETIRSFSIALPKAKIVVVDNNSRDKTSNAALQSFIDQKLQNRAFLLNEPKQGKANALRKAFFEIDADIYIVSDADMTYSASDVYKLIDPILSGTVDMVIGDRHSLGFYKKTNKRPFHNFGNFIINSFVNFFFKSNLNDVMSGYRSISRDFIENYPILVSGFEIETDITLFALDKGFRIKEVPIPYKERPLGSTSKLNTFRDGFMVLLIIIQALRFYKPLFFFTSISTFFFTLSIFSAMPVIYEYIYTNIVLHVPLAVLSASLMILSMVFLGIGIVLDSIRHQNQINFELRIMDLSKNRKN